MAVELTSTSDLDYLIDYLRIHLGDTSSTFTYSNDTLKLVLLAGLKMLMPRWNSRYVPTYNASTENWDVARSATDIFTHASPPIIMYGDERPILLAAAIALKSGLIYTVGSNAVSWRDDEVSFSNMTGAKMQEASLLRDWEELGRLVPERRQRLARSKKGELLGYKFPPNRWESENF